MGDSEHNSQGAEQPWGLKNNFFKNVYCFEYEYKHFHTIKKKNYFATDSERTMMFSKENKRNVSNFLIKKYDLYLKNISTLELPEYIYYSWE